MKSSIAQQRQAIEHCLALLADNEPQFAHFIEQARDGCRTLAWLEKRQHLVKAIAELDKQAPQLAALFEAFPGLKIADVRKTEPMRTSPYEIS